MADLNPRTADPLFTEQKRAHLEYHHRFTVAESNWAGLIFGHQERWQTAEILANRCYFWWYGSPPGQLTLAVSYSESGADGRIRTGDPLFTNQDLCRPSGVVICQQVSFRIRPLEISCP